MGSLTLPGALVAIVAIICGTVLGMNGDGPQAVVAVLGGLGLTGLTSQLSKIERTTASKIDVVERSSARVEKAANGLSTRLAASSFNDGYRAGFADAKGGRDPENVPVVTMAPHLLDPIRPPADLA